MALGLIGAATAAAVFLGVRRPLPPAPPPGVIGAESRRLLDDFPLPAGLKAGEFAASLDLLCGGQLASATLVGPDLILFSAHQILHDDGSRNFGPDQPCAVLLEGDLVLPIRPDSLVTGRFRLDKGEQGRFAATVTAADWALARLAAPVPGVRPYALAETPPPPGAHIVNVAAAQDNYPATGAGEYGLRLAQDCRLLAQDHRIGRFDCDSGRGASGSALLWIEAAAPPRLIGILTDSARSPQGCRVADPAICFAAGPLLTPELRARILSAAPPG